MKKARKIDFLIYEDSFSKTIFRFYPRQSSCHSFNETPPKTWEDVYKVYYTYAVILIWKDDNCHEILFDSDCDECSVIDEVAMTIKLINEGNRTYTKVNPLTQATYTIELFDRDIFPFGDGVTWSIHEVKKDSSYDIYMWGWKNKGYRFFLKKEKFKAFGEFLDKCNEYMLEHGDPI